MVAIAGAVGLWATGEALASGNSSLAFAANSDLVSNRREIKTEYNQKVTEAREAKAAKIAEEKRLAEEAAKEAEAARLAAQKQAEEAARQQRLIAMNRSESSSRSSNGSGVYASGTAYTPDPAENGGWNVTATGENLQDLVNSGENIVAYNGVPLNSHITIDGVRYRVADRVGRDGVVDRLVGSKAEAAQYGRQHIHIEAIELP